MVWVLTMSVNDYNQYGDYFIDAWRRKPSKEQLLPHVSDWFCGPDVDPVRVLLETDGGRQGSEDRWFNLAEVNGAEAQPSRAEVLTDALTALVAKWERWQADGDQRGCPSTNGMSAAISDLRAALGLKDAP
jgi:hypothetical protein